MKLKSTRLEYRFEDASGYGFDVVATLDGLKKGWSAVVSFDAHGYVTAEDAVQHLRHAAEAFLRQLDEAAQPAQHWDPSTCQRCKGFITHGHQCPVFEPQT